MPQCSSAKHPSGYTITFTEADHSYKSVINGRELKYVSGTQFLSRYFPPFDPTGEITRRCALKEGISAEEIKRKWADKGRESCRLGTRMHERIEDCLLSQPARNIPEDETEAMRFKNAIDIAERIKAKTDIVGVEKIVFSPDLGIAGTIDGLLKSRKDGTYYIIDHKGIDINEPILTTTGWKTMGTVNVGDRVFDKDGNDVEILNVSDIHYNPCYKIKFDNNATIIVDHEHKWVINAKHKEHIMQTKELYDYIKMLEQKNRQGLSYYRPKIYCGKPVQSSTWKCPIISPYVLGVWLGDGHSACSMVTNMYDEIFDRIAKCGYSIGNPIKQRLNKAKTRNIGGLHLQLKQLNLLKNKHIPVDFLTAPLSIKKEILAGFMDTDGYYHAKRRRYVCSTTRKNQVDFIVKLLSSMSIKSTVIYQKAMCQTNKNIDSWVVCFACDFNPFGCRKIKTEFPKTDSRTFFNIKSIEKCLTVPTRCITVNSPSHTYRIGRDLIVTHNSNAKIEDKDENPYGKFCLGPISHLPDTSVWHYACQLNLYEYLLKREKYVPKDSKFRLFLNHVTPECAKLIELPDLQTEIRELLIDYLILKSETYLDPDLGC